MASWSGRHQGMVGTVANSNMGAMSREELFFSLNICRSSEMIGKKS